MTASTLSTSELIERAGQGDRDAAANLFERIYDDLCGVAGRLMRRERRDHALQTTGLVHEAFVRIAGVSSVSLKGKTHFLALSSHVMRQILVDHARKRLRLKRGGDRVQLNFDAGEVLSRGRSSDVLAVEDALNRLAELDTRQAQIVEMRFFGGMTVEEVAESLGVSKRTIEADWTMAKAWLRRELAGDAS
jgi:RNA polymerase sigma-70 factor (ECF subfamily)